MKRTSRLVFLFGLSLFASAGSRAHADRSQHRDVVVKPLKEGNKVVGARISVVFQDHDQYGKVVLALSPPALRAKSGAVQPGFTSKGPNRNWFVDPTQVHLLPVKDMPPNNTPTEAIFEIRYGEGNTFKGGEKLDLVSTWSDAPMAEPIHTWGAVMGWERPANHQSDITLPAATP